MFTYDVDKLEARAAKLELRPVDIFHRILKFPPEERISKATVSRVFQTRSGHPVSIQAIAKALGYQSMKNLIKVPHATGR